MTTSSAATPSVAPVATTREHADLLQTLATHRNFLHYTVRDLTDEQATRRTTASELTLAGLIKHVTACEENWLRFVLGGPGSMEGSEESWEDGWRMLPAETLASLLARYEEVANRTDEIVRSLPDLDADHPLPVAPWFEPGARWSARRVLLHVIAETSQHAGHADIIRESLDGQKTMG
ncbi:DinB family protein [Actinopolymorpha alba]|uniref:DinB family protein n=1 Tax=Actinopolymorpha alba TaxID=533267 RepID=UPI00036D838C|nr:DinB family protein [Actinopolymorpha alba]